VSQSALYAKKKITERTSACLVLLSLELLGNDKLVQCTKKLTIKNSCTYLVCEATECSEIRLREGDKDAGCSVSTNHRPVSAVKVIQRIYE